MNYSVIKKFFLAFTFFLSAFFLFGEDYRIQNVTYNISGNTKKQALERTVPVSKNKVFNSIEDLEYYIGLLKQDLINTRCFETSEIEYTISNSSENPETLVDLTINVTDSYHFLALPYFKYSSSNGLSAKIKAKDTNFLGTMNDFNTSIDFMLKPDENGTPFKVFEPELALSYDFPFKLGSQEMTWINNHSISYTWGESSPEWNFMTGLITKIPVNQTFAINLKFEQSFIRNFDYRDTGDETYFNENFSIYSDLILYDFNGNSGVRIPVLDKLTLTPVLSLNYAWDPININGRSGFLNPELRGPDISFAPELTFGKVNWRGNFRNGLSGTITPSISYNFASISSDRVKPLSLSIYSNVKGYKDLNFMGINTQFTGFAYAQGDYFGGNQKVCNLVRGVIDNRYSLYQAPEAKPQYQGKTPAAFVLNLDLPLHIFTTDWENFPVTNKIKFMRHLNFELQVSPFMDIALITTDPLIHGTNNVFSFQDGLYGAGIEVLVFPLKWSSYVVRASIGVDIGRKFLEDYTDTPWRNTNCKKYEISIGLGTFY